MGGEANKKSFGSWTNVYWGEMVYWGAIPANFLRIELRNFKWYHLSDIYLFIKLFKNFSFKKLSTTRYKSVICFWFWQISFCDQRVFMAINLVEEFMIEFSKTLLKYLELCFTTPWTKSIKIIIISLRQNPKRRKVGMFGRHVDFPPWFPMCTYTYPPQPSSMFA